MPMFEAQLPVEEELSSQSQSWEQELTPHPLHNDGKVKILAKEITIDGPHYLIALTMLHPREGVYVLRHLVWCLDTTSNEKIRPNDEQACKLEEMARKCWQQAVLYLQRTGWLELNGMWRAP